MIHYALRCAAGHEFDGWFADSNAFDRQAESGLVECPFCGLAKVSRALMAPAVARTELQLPANPPAALLASLQQLRATIEANAENVGDDFPVIVRAMHEGEIEPSNIYGNTTEDEAESLHDEGIGIARIPWVPRADS